MLSGTIADEKEAFRELATAQLDRLYATARRLVGDDAEDAVQEALLKAYKSFAQLRNRDAAGSWLMQILVNSCRDQGRARSRQPDQIDIDEVEEFSLYRKIAHEDPFPYSRCLDKSSRRELRLLSVGSQGAEV